MWVLVISIILQLGLVLANTETINIKIPYYYDIPPPTALQHPWSNTTHTVIHQFPVGTIKTTTNAGPLPVTLSTPTTLIHINNYDDTFSANDIINVKFCWPATSPYKINLDHIYSSEWVEKTDPHTNRVDLFVRIAIEPEGYSNLGLDPEPLEANIYVSKVPSSLVPIPIELYYLLPYLVGVVAGSITLAPYIYDLVFGK